MKTFCSPGNDNTEAKPTDLKPCAWRAGDRLRFFKNGRLRHHLCDDFPMVGKPVAIGEVFFFGGNETWFQQVL